MKVLYVFIILNLNLLTFSVNTSLLDVPFSRRNLYVPNVRYVKMSIKNQYLNICQFACYDDKDVNVLINKAVQATSSWYGDNRAKIVTGDLSLSCPGMLHTGADAVESITVDAGQDVIITKCSFVFRSGYPKE